ncbi:MAG: AtpZ/AtpI family protein [Clostridia bacterium]|nr:AtpZ/AtpI family protein [Clostridia bacterium]
MYKKLVGALYIMNIVSQAIFTLLLPILVGLGISWLLVTYLSAPSFIYVILIMLGVLSGLYSMVRFVLSAMAAYERLEKEQTESKKTNKTGNNNG